VLSISLKLFYGREYASGLKSNFTSKELCAVDTNSEIIIVTADGVSKAVNPGSWFIASHEPFFLGVILPPEPHFWAKLASSKSVSAEFPGSRKNFRVEQRIEVGSNSIFFLRAIE
jgi:hypothetical protein